MDTEQNSFLRGILEDYSNEPDCEFEPIFTDDRIINLFNYFKIPGKGGDEFRLKYDGDARYYHLLLNDPHLALYADTIISFYTPYKEMLKRTTGVIYHKCNKPFDELIEKRNEPGFKEVNDQFAMFIDLYFTAGNYLLLPERKMNNDRYQCSEDRIDKSLTECFPGGELSKYFGNSNGEQLGNIEKWVEEQRLEMLFEGEKIEKTKIIPFNKANPFASYKTMTDEELCEFLDGAVKFIGQRNAVLGVNS